MKNSLFKRVFAAVASVPFALSQCLTYSSYAVTNDSVQVETANARAGGEVYNLEKLLYIEPGQTESTWYDTVHTELVNIGESDNNVRFIEKAMLEDLVVKNAGKYTDRAKMALDMLDDKGIEYRVSSSGDVVITARIKTDFGVFFAEAQKSIDEAVDKAVADAMEEVKQKYEDAKAEISEKFDIPAEEFDDFNVSKEYLAEKYGIPLEDLDKYNFTKEDIAEKLEIPVEDLEGVDNIDNVEEIIYEEKVNIPPFDFTSADFTGAFEITIKGSELEDGHTMGIKARYISDKPVNIDGVNKTVLSIADLTKFAEVKIEEVKACADVTIREIPDEDAKKDAQAQVTNQLTKIENLLKKAESKFDIIHREQNRTASADNMAQLLKKISDFVENSKKVQSLENKIHKDIRVPSSVTDMMNNSHVADLYETIMNDLNEIAVSYNISLPASDIAAFADTDLRNIKATAVNDTYTLSGFFHDEELGGDNLKEMIATVEVGDIYDTDKNIATIGLQIFRPEIEDTSTSTSTTTTTSTVSTDNTTTTTTVSTDDTTATTTETTGTDDDGSSTTTTETTGTDDDGSSTTTTETTGTDDDGSSTTTTETSGTDTTTTTTTFGGSVLPDEVSRLFATVTAGEEGEYGFYYSYETEFHKEQVKEVAITVIYRDGKEEIIPITYEFASTPAETFVKYDVDFKYTAALVYNGGDITDSTGKVVLKSGDVLKTSDGADAGVVAYIGYRGDVNLDYEVNAVDASQEQAYYAILSTGKTTDQVVLSDSNLVESASSIYDQFAAFLGDVNMSNQDGEIVNWKTGKKGRTVDAVDATCIMVAYAQLSIKDTPYKVGDEALWDYVLTE